MAYVNGYDHDVFVSYSHLDDSPVADRDKGRITTFVQTLKTELTQRLGSKGLDVWFDHVLEGNKPLTSQLASTLRRSATLLIVMTPGYLGSTWCARERNAFLSFARECVDQGRIFVVRLRETERGQEPAELGDLTGFKFFSLDPDTGIERPLESGEKDYVQRLYELSQHLARQLKGMNGPPPEAAAAPRPAVFLARATDDLADEEEELRSYLAQAQIDVLPRAWYPETDADSFSVAMKADLAKARVFVQLASERRGRRLAATDQRLPRLQHDIARAAGARMLQWRDSRLDLGRAEDAAQRELLDGAQASRFEDFKRAVLEQATRADEAPSAPNANVVAFVDADAKDLGIAVEVSNALSNQGIGCFWPMAQGTQDQARQDLERSLSDCDGVILVYGAAEPLWVREHLRNIVKIVSQRERPLSALALYVAPPPEKGELAFRLPNLITLDCRAGLNVGALHGFVKHVLARD